MKNYLGLDLSLTETGIAFSNGQHYSIKTSSKQFKNSIIRCEYIADKIIEYTTVCKPALISIETYFHGKFTRTLISLCELGTIVRYKLLKANFNILLVTPAELKKFATNKGNSKKPLIIKAVYQKYGINTNNDNIADAIVLSKIAEAFEGNNNNELLKYESEVINKLRKDTKSLKNL